MKMNRKNRFFCAVTGLVLLLGLAVTVRATTVRSVNLKDMVHLADRIFLGHCVELQQVRDSGIGIPVVEYTFYVERGIKGVRTGQTVVFRQLQSSRVSRFGVPGMPHFASGQQILLFLYADSRLGLTSPVGLEQGIFHQERMPDGEMGLVNQQRNVNLKTGWDLDQMQESGLSQAQAQRLQKSEPIPLREFQAMVERVENQGSGKGKVQQ